MRVFFQNLSLLRQNQTSSAQPFVYDNYSPSNPISSTLTERKLHMKDITKEYLLLFNTITDTEEALRQLRAKLMAAQQQAELLFLEETDLTDASRSA